MKSHKPQRRDAKSAPPKSPSEKILALLTDKRKPLRRRYMHAKDSLKRGEHVLEALAVLHQVTESRLPNHQKDRALRLLARWERKKKPNGSSENPFTRYGPSPYWEAGFWGEICHKTWGGTILPEGVECNKNTPPEHRQWPADQLADDGERDDEG